jgi:hypothetical protein
MFFNQVESNIGYDLYTYVKEKVKTKLKCKLIRVKPELAHEGFAHLTPLFVIQI